MSTFGSCVRLCMCHNLALEKKCLLFNFKRKLSRRHILTDDDLTCKLFSASKTGLGHASAYETAERSADPK